jgi:CBS domain-containing protein
MSPRAAWRLERFGFQTYDYTLGKADWLAAGQPTVRREPAAPRALDALDIDVLTCGPDDVIGSVASRADADICVVVNEHRIVLGRLGPKELASPPDVIAEGVMQPGPATVRANEPLDELLTRMAEHNVRVMIVTTPEARLLGVVR